MPMIRYSRVIELLLLPAGVAAWVAVSVSRRLLSDGVRVRRRFHRTRAVAIAEAQPGGWVKLAGHLAAEDQLLDAPISGRRCAAYEVAVEALERNVWKELRTVTAVRDFRIEDPSGQALVRVGAPWFLFADKQRFDPREPAVAAFLRDQMLWAGPAKRPPQLRVNESVLMPGHLVAALGWATQEPDPDPQGWKVGYREVPMRLVLVAPQGGAIAISDERMVGSPGR